MELKWLEHEQQHILQQKRFEDKMCALEQQQVQELLNIQHKPNAPNRNTLLHLATSVSMMILQVNVIVS
jgi:hypothetical protein